MLNSELCEDTNYSQEPDEVADNCYPGSWEAEAGRLEFKAVWAIYNIFRLAWVILGDCSLKNKRKTFLTPQPTNRPTITLHKFKKYQEGGLFPPRGIPLTWTGETVFYWLIFGSERGRHQRRRERGTQEK